MWNALTRSSFPWPCSNMLMPGRRRADAINDCFMLDGLMTLPRFNTELLVRREAVYWGWGGLNSANLGLKSHHCRRSPHKNDNGFAITQEAPAASVQREPDTVTLPHQKCDGTGHNRWSHTGPRQRPATTPVMQRRITLWCHGYVALQNTCVSSIHAKSRFHMLILPQSWSFHGGPICNDVRLDAPITSWQLLQREIPVNAKNLSPWHIYEIPPDCLWHAWSTNWMPKGTLDFAHTEVQFAMIKLMFPSKRNNYAVNEHTPKLSCLWRRNEQSDVQSWCRPHLSHPSDQLGCSTSWEQYKKCCMQSVHTTKILHVVSKTTGQLDEGNCCHKLPVKWSIISDGRHHDDLIGCQLPDLCNVICTKSKFYGMWQATSRKKKVPLFSKRGGQRKQPGTHLIHKRMVHKVWSTNTQVQDVDFLQYGIVECIQEPGGVGDLVVGEDSEDIEVCIGSKAQTVLVAGNDTCYKGAMAQACQTERRMATFFRTLWTSTAKSRQERNSAQNGRNWTGHLPNPQPTIFQSFLIGPVGPVLDSTFLEMWMVLGQTRVKDGNFNTSTCGRTRDERLSGKGLVGPLHHAEMGSMGKVTKHDILEQQWQEHLFACLFDGLWDGTKTLIVGFYILPV